MAACWVRFVTCGLQAPAMSGQPSQAPSDGYQQQYQEEEVPQVFCFVHSPGEAALHA